MTSSSPSLCRPVWPGFQSDITLLAIVRAVKRSGGTLESGCDERSIRRDELRDPDADR
jgi:hypothetical protein